MIYHHQRIYYLFILRPTKYDTPFSHTRTSNRAEETHALIGIIRISFGAFIREI